VRALRRQDDPVLYQRLTARLQPSTA
jgi:hypothetical protein